MKVEGAKHGTKKRSRPAALLELAPDRMSEVIIGRFISGEVDRNKGAKPHEGKRRVTYHVKSRLSRSGGVVNTIWGVLHVYGKFHVAFDAADRTNGRSDRRGTQPCSGCIRP